MKKYLFYTFVMMTLSSCAMRPDGTRTFAGLDGGQWTNVGLEASATYVETKRNPLLSGKTVEEEVTAEVKLKTSLLDLGLALLGL